MPESKSGALPLGDSPELLFREIMHGMTIQSLAPQNRSYRTGAAPTRPCRGLSGELGKYASAGARHCRYPRTIELLEPVQMARHLRIKPAYHRLKIVMPMLDGKGRYFDWNRVSCQFLTAKNLRRWHLHGRRQDQIPGGRQGDRLKVLRLCLQQTHFPENEHRHIRPKSEPKLQQPIPFPAQAP